MKSDSCFDYFQQLILADKDKYYNDYLKVYNQVQKSSAIYQGEPVDFLYQPMFYDVEDVNILNEVCLKLINILDKVIDEYRNNPGFRDNFGFPDLMEKLILVDPGYDFNFPIARFDVFYHEDNLKFCELNTDGSSAMNEARVLQELFLDSSIINDMKDKYKFYNYELFYSWIDSVINNYKEYTDNPEPDPNIAIVDFEGEGTINEFKEFKNRFIKKGYDTIICDPRNLEYRDNTLYYQNFPVDIVYRRATTSRLIEEADNIKDFIKAYLDKAICLIGGFVSQIPHNKKIFAILHNKDQISFLNEDECNFIKKHIPYTVIFNYEDKNLRKEISQNKDNYILKPCDWYACHGVYAGKDYNQKKWDELLLEIKEENYIVQEYCQVPSRNMLTVNRNQEDMYFEEYNYLTGLFLYNYKLCGLYTRAGRKNVIGTLVESFTLPSFISKNRD